MGKPFKKHLQDALNDMSAEELGMLDQLCKDRGLSREELTRELVREEDKRIKEMKQCEAVCPGSPASPESGKRCILLPKHVGRHITTTEGSTTTWPNNGFKNAITRYD